MRADRSLQPRKSEAAMLEVRDLVVAYKQGGRAVRAVDGISFDVNGGETVGLVGESGCGKSSTVRAIARLQEPTGGSIWIRGEEVTRLRGAALRRLRMSVQII